MAASIEGLQNEGREETGEGYQASDDRRK